ncbi:MAG: hypothetical protein SGJ27_31425 [Candidatus Melainabacteria bacterium]|nr:hypothetical protein [Candidatus Melainabacteria bacterium]
MSSKNTRARDSFMIALERGSRMQGQSATNNAVARGLKAIGTSLIASQFGLFADQLAALTDKVEVLLKGDKNVSIKCELVVPGVTFDTFGTVFLKADGAMVVDGIGSKDKKQLDTYRIPVVLDVAVLKDPAVFVSEMRVLIDKLYAAGERSLASK